jgi:hypothetical protein
MELEELSLGVWAVRMGGTRRGEVEGEVSRRRRGGGLRGGGSGGGINKWNNVGRREWEGKKGFGGAGGSRRSTKGK